MKIQLKTRAAGRLAGGPGDVLDVSSADGKALVDGGYAIDVTPKAVQKPVQVETATADPVVETATPPKVTRRKRAKK